MTYKLHILHKIVIIPDIHNGVDDVDEIINKEKPDLIVFLGDYFDSFYDNESVCKHTTNWLVQSLKKSNRIHLLGNHDLSYIASIHSRCMGWTQYKQDIIDSFNINWNNFYKYYWLDDYLCTHAGLTKNFAQLHIIDKINRVSITKFLKNTNIEMLSDVSSIRGGNNIESGIFWCDYSEFKPIRGISQIFGHTTQYNARKVGNNICLDTNLRNYIVYDRSSQKLNICNHESKHALINNPRHQTMF